MDGLLSSPFLSSLPNPHTHHHHRRSRTPHHANITIKAIAESRATAEKQITRAPTIPYHDQHHHPSAEVDGYSNYVDDDEGEEEEGGGEVGRRRRRGNAVVVDRRSHRPPPTPSIASTICGALDVFINTFMDGPPRPSMDPRHVLSGNFSPVDELPPVACPVIKGSIPPCLGGGAYIRNGPNPQHLPLGPYHLFDGDGMLHSLLLPEGGGRAPATLCSRFVHTYKYRLERDAGGPLMHSPFATFGGGSLAAGMARFAVSAARVASGQMNPLEGGVGLANTSLVYFADRLFALGESDLPYAVHLSPTDGDITTIGREDFGGKLSMGMTAHPKKDPLTGELFAFRYGPIPPFLTYFWFDEDGKKQGEVPVLVGMAQPAFLHDFAITARHAVFVDMQITVKPMDMLFPGGGGTAGVSPVGTESKKVPRIGVMPRYATSEMELRWFDAPGFNPVHTVNAWDEDDGRVIVLVAPNILSVEHALERMELVHSCVEMVRIDLRDGTVTRRPLSAANLDFSVVNPLYVGRQSRYAYAGIGDPMPKISGVVKLDMIGTSGECVVGRRMFGPGCFGGEPFFVPGDGDVDEDDGYLVSYVHDEGRDESRFVVMDAKSEELDIVAEVLLPRRVPYGFHGLFVSGSELRRQRI